MPCRSSLLSTFCQHLLLIRSSSGSHCIVLYSINVSSLWSILSSSFSKWGIEIYPRSATFECSVLLTPLIKRLSFLWCLAPLLRLVAGSTLQRERVCVCLYICVLLKCVEVSLQDSSPISGSVSTKSLWVLECRKKTSSNYRLLLLWGGGVQMVNNPQHLHGGSRPSLSPVPRVLMPSLASVATRRTWCTDTHTYKILVHVIFLKHFVVEFHYGEWFLACHS